MLSEELLAEFDSRGVVVIPNVLNSNEISECRSSFHNYLLTRNVDIENLNETGGNLRDLSSTGGSGGVLDVFYEDWKLKVNEHHNVVNAMQQLWGHTYSGDRELYAHPYGRFDSNRGYMYIDRVCFRVPDTISSIHSISKKKTLQRSLTPHLDCCPHKLYSASSDKKVPKWRPIQAFIALTDTPEKNQGGFEACPGLHREFNEWVARRPPSTVTDANGKSIESEPPCVGEFTPIRPKEDAEIISRFEHIPCRAGDMVCWDYRIPHGNSRHNNSDTVREAIYIGLLPAIEMNKEYALNQLQDFLNGDVPRDQWHESSSKQSTAYEFTQVGRKLMAIDSWDEVSEQKL
jgi:ectoine hydroxylase-related dioxygenase (phytanoyl-CoA dioxygenase family)